MLRHGKGVRALGLPVPTGDARETVCDVFNFDIER
jgi:hypothetical protein